jgi:DNA-binding CsgD family transcriptional regulator
MIAGAMTGTHLWERGLALDAIGECVTRARAGEGGALFVIGEAGLGKTALLAHACGLAADDFDVGRGRGEAMEGTLAFGLAAQAVGGLAGAQALGLGGGGAPVAEPTAPYYRVLRWLQARDERPLLLVLDDLHWADADSLRLVAFVVRRLAGLRVAVVGALRSWPLQARDVVRELVAGGHAQLVRLDGLSEPSARELLVERCGAALSDGTAGRAWQLCRGNPLLIEQLALAMTRGEDVFEDAVTALRPEHLLLTRFAGLDAAGLGCARAASVLGTSFRAEIAAELAGLTDRAVDAALDGLCHSGLVVETDGAAMRFAHPLFAQALYDDLSPAVRRRYHARACVALAGRGLDGEACDHAIRADLIGDADAIAVLERAGRAALAAGAVATAARDLEAAVRFSGDRADARLLLVLAEALSASGQMHAAAGVARVLLSRDRLAWHIRLEGLRLLGRAHYLTGASDYGDAAFADAVALAVAHDPTRAIRPLLDQSLSAWLSGGPALALPFAVRARDLARDAEPDLRDAAVAAWGYLALESGDPAGLAATDPLRRHVDEGVTAHALAPGELVWPWASIYMFAMNANYAERHDDAERTFKLARTVVERAGAADALATLAIYIANLVIRRGLLEEALAEAIRAKELAELTPGVLPYAELMHAEALAWSGRFEDAASACDAAERAIPEQWFATIWIAHVRGMLALWRGDLAASDILLVAESATREAGIREPCHVHWAGHAIAAHIAALRTADAVRVIEWLEDCARPLTCAWPRIAATLGRAELAAHDGDDEAADRHFTAALALHEQTDLPLHRIEALQAYGAFLRRRGRSVEARPHLVEALCLAEHSGAGWHAQTAASELRLAHGRRRRGPEQRDQLTPAQQRVAELAAVGASNAEIARQLFLSVNTVQTHLKHVYTKLQISSRRELMTRNQSSISRGSDHPNQG